MNPTATRTAFRAVAIAEALSWALLLSAMFCKYATKSEPFGLREGGVPVAGMIHGVVFVVFVVMCFVSRRAFGWSRKVTLVALASSIPPFCSVLFERGADARGLLESPRAHSSGATSKP
ncbi:DUF3817 domain-containing protein [Aeromicrobium sp.]|uniref:DUF3817 domain-containing protein n=1 Tax=Aeromicrobium sp. TaxID=1871063 RepID=UPI0019C3E249|nr:DUF3817 domain-containing protein [Aeromicrobium sp.]MBC7632134.1 DUF3817 domain-containing protein [Aeromicrobium sp.]